MSAIPQTDFREMPLEELTRLAASAALEKQRREDVKGLKDLPNFVRQGWTILDPAQQLLWNWHHDLICEYLMLVFQGVIKRLIINIPPRGTKSRLVSVLFPAYCWSQKPTLNFIHSSYEAGISTDFNVDKRVVLQSEWYQKSFPGIVQFASDQNQKTQYQNTARGESFSTSMGGSITGKGANILIIDDPIKPKDAFSDDVRTNCNRDYDNTFRSRLNNPDTDAVILVMQRTHQLDLTGHVTDKEKGAWTVVSLPMRAELEEEVIIFPISGRRVVRKKGDCLQPNRWSRDWCEATEAIDAYTWAGQYQQRPAPLGGGIFKEADLQFYRRRDLPKSFDASCQSWDCAFKDTKDSAFVAGHVWARKGVNFYFIDRRHEKLNMPRTCAAVKELTVSYPWANDIVIEDKANGPAVIDTLKDEIPNIVPFDPGEFGDKVARAYAVQTIHTNHHVWLPHPEECPWIKEVIGEWITFPNSAFKDDTDSMTQAILFLRTKMYGALDYFEMLRKEFMDHKEAQKISKIETTTTLAKPEISSDTPQCPQCSSLTIGKIPGNLNRCQACACQFDQSGRIQIRGSGTIGISRGDLNKAGKL